MFKQLNTSERDNKLSVNQEEELKAHLEDISAKDLIPHSHIEFLIKLRDEHNFNPKVIYDIGSCVLYWTKKTKQIWPDSKFILFDAFEPAEFLYKGYDYHIGVLSDSDDKQVKFYYNNQYPGGNSYYKERGDIFQSDVYKIMKCNTLDNIVKQRNFPLPDLIKIDVQGSEKDIIKGSIETIKNTEYMIVEMQHEQYNEGAPLIGETREYIESLGWECIAEKIADNGPDADYCFKSLRPKQLGLIQF